MEEDIIEKIEKCKKSRLPEGEEYIFGEEALLQEDIKVLEELISWKGKNVEIRDYEIQAIENLIKGYKELEEKRKTTMEVIGANYIHKDKVREKIEFYKRYGKIKNSEEYVMSVEIEVLQELLEERN